MEGLRQGGGWEGRLGHWRRDTHFVEVCYGLAEHDVGVEPAHEEFGHAGGEGGGEVGVRERI